MSSTGLSNTETKVAPQSEPLEPHSGPVDPFDFDFWAFAGIGIALGGGALGFLTGCLPGFFVGGSVTGIIGFPFILTFGALSWSCWLTRFSIPMAIVSGACTGIASTFIVGEAFSLFPTSGSYFYVYLAGIAAGISCAIGAGISTSIYVRRHNCTKFSMRCKRQPWRFSLSDLFVRFTVVTVLIAGWTWAAKAYFGPW